MAIFAKDSFDAQLLLQTRPATPLRPPSPLIEKAIDDETKTQKVISGKPESRKENKLENEILKILAKSVVCGTVAWDEADSKVKSYTYFCIGTGRRKSVSRKKPNVDIQKVPIKDLWTELNKVFVSEKKNV